MTNDILLHVRGYRQFTIGRVDRIATSLPEHMAIIEALEERDTELAEKRARDHTLGLATYVETHGQELLSRTEQTKTSSSKKRSGRSRMSAAVQSIDAKAEVEREQTDGFHLIIDALKLNGVNTIYGVPGIPITDFGRMAQAEGIRVHLVPPRAERRQRRRRSPAT